MKEDMRKLNIMEDMVEDIRQVTHITSNPRSGKQGSLNNNDDDDDDDDDDEDDVKTMMMTMMMVMTM